MKHLIHSLEGRLAPLPLAVAVELPSGERVGPSSTEVLLRFRSLAPLAALAAGQIGALGAAVVEGQLELEGRVRDIMRAAAALLPADPVLAAPGWWEQRLARLRSRALHTLVRDAQQVQFHYDLSDDFYRLWLDPHRVYSCAYYRQPDMDLAQAQEAKLDHICRKLRLQPGERLLDIGAGWGGLLFWAAEHYGVQAHGITLSRNQHAYVNQRIAERGLQGQVHMALCDYRELAPETAFDKLASVGMFEHVGQAQMLAYGHTLHRLLKPGGLALVHGITAGGVRNAQVGAGMGEFISRYIFPGGELMHVSRILQVLAESGLEMVDTENLRPHYARTLWAWSDALEAQLPQAQRILAAQSGEEQGARALRAYRLYLAGCAMGFERGWTALHQMLVTRPDGQPGDDVLVGAQSEYPFNRAYMYSEGKPCPTSSNPAPPRT